MPDEKIQLIVTARDDASKTIGGIQGKVKSMGAEMKQGFAQGFGLAGGVGIAAMAVKATDAVVGFMTDSIAAASDLNETLSKSSIIFGENEGAVEEWASTAATAMGESKTQALDTASGFAGLFQTVGIGKEKVVGFSEGMTQMGADLASFFNTDVQTALDALKSGLNGESEPLRQFNVFLSETAVTAELTKEGIQKVNGQFTEGQKVQARYNLIMQQTGSAQGDFARTSDGLANSQRTLNAELEDAKASFGQALLPIMVDLAHVAKDVMGAFNSLSPEMKSTAALMVGLAVVGTPVVLMFGKLVDAGKMVVSGISTLAKVIPGMTAATEADTVATEGNTAAKNANRISIGALAGAVGLIAIEYAIGDDLSKKQAASADAASAGVQGLTNVTADQAAQMRVAADQMDATINSTKIMGVIDTDATRSQLALAAQLRATADAADKQAGSLDTNLTPAYQSLMDQIGQHGLSEHADAMAQEAADVAKKQATAYHDEVNRNKNSLSIWAIERNKQIADAAAWKELWDKSARAITGDIVGELKGAKDNVGNAMKDLMWALNHPLAMQHRLTEIQADLNSKALARGLASQYPWIQDAAKQQQQKWLDEWKQLDPKGYAAAHAASAAVQDGLNDDYPAALRDASKFVDRYNAIFGALRLNYKVNVDVARGLAGKIGHLPTYASGGDVDAGTTALVGERGPEVVTFGRDAHVWPNGGGGNSVPPHSHDIHIDGRKVMAAVDPHIGKRLAMTSSGAYTRG